MILKSTSAPVAPPCERAEEKYPRSPASLDIIQNDLQGHHPVALCRSIYKKIIVNDI